MPAAQWRTDFLFSFEEGQPSAGVVTWRRSPSKMRSLPAQRPARRRTECNVRRHRGRRWPRSHLILLDGVSGEIRWDEPIYDPATYVSGQVNDHVAVVGVYDSGPSFVDLDTAESVRVQNSPDSYWLLVGEELAQFDNGSLELGLDPFDPAVLAAPVPLPSGTDSVTASEDGRLIVATVASNVVGIVDGEEVWTWTPDVEGIGQVLLVDGFVGVWELVDGVFGRRLFAEIGDSGVVPLDTFPDAFRLEDISFADDGTPALVGIIDETPDMSSRDERVRAAIVELRTGSPVHEIADDLNGMGTAGAFGAYVYTASVIDGQIALYDAETLEQVGEIPFIDDDDVRPRNLQVADNEIVVYDPEQLTISVYA